MTIVDIGIVNLGASEGHLDGPEVRRGLGKLTRGRSGVGMCRGLYPRRESGQSERPDDCRSLGGQRRGSEEKGGS